MIPHNIIIILIIIIFSFLFKMREIKNYDTQLLFIILSFLNIIIYKSIDYAYNNIHNTETFVNNEEEQNTEFTNTKDTDVLINELQEKVQLYENQYGVISSNDIELLESNIKLLEDRVNELKEKAINSKQQTSSSEDKLEAADEGVTINGASKFDVEDDTSAGSLVDLDNINTDAVRNLLIDKLKEIKVEYEKATTS